MIRVSRQSDLSVRGVAPLLAALVALVGAVALSACGSSGAVAPEASPPGVRSVAITAVLPQDAATEPPWNGRFVQVTVRAPSPQRLVANDWSVFVDGKKQRLADPPNILPYAPDAATVAFVFTAPFTDLVDYRFRVVYAPDGGRTVERSWLYKWAP